MPNTDICDLEEALTKTGTELFKELYRIYPVAEAEDYFKNGQWKNEVMKTDLMLIESHRRESGAPDVADLEDIKVPNLPQPGANFGAYFAAAPVTQHSAMGTVGPKPAGMATPATVAGTAIGNSTPVVEIRLIALFVAKWKLDPATAKTSLAKLTPARRRYVIQNFKTTTTGVEATKELDLYIAECEESKVWDSESAATATNGTPAPAPAAEMTAAGKTAIVCAKAAIQPKAQQPRAVAPRPVGSTTVGATATTPAVTASGLKRPLTPAAANPMAWQQNKAVRPAAVVRPPAWGKGAGKF